jgi:hypothetical protein
MSGARQSWLLLIARMLLGVLLGLGACDACGPRSAPIATLVERNGQDVQRDYAAKLEQWSAADVGTTFVLGDGVRTGVSASSVLALVDGSRLQLKAKTKIRFLIDGAGQDERGIDLLTGEALLFAGKSDLRLRTHVGLAILSSGGQMLLTREADGVRMHIDVGEARFRDANGQEQRIGAGEDVLLQVGMAILRSTGADAPGAEPLLPNGGGDFIANVQADGVRVKAPGDASFRDLARGQHPVAKGTALRLPAGTFVELKRGQNRASLQGAGDFIVGQGGFVEAQRGKLLVEAKSEDVAIKVPGGVIIARAASGGSRAQVELGPDEGQLAVEMGSVTFRGSDGVHELSSGASHRWAAAASPTVDARAPNDESGPDFLNIQVRAGESFVVHAPEVPVALAFDFSHKCKGQGVVELTQGKQRSRGVGKANLSIPPGARGYTVRCIDARGVPGAVVARGTAHVLRDAGTRDLPARAPTSIVEADGRSYTIYYQNQMPAVRVSWPNPPSATSYQLLTDDKTIAVKTPEHLFESGDLRDGVHRLTFSAGSRKSRTAKVDVRFDNTAATASLSTPSDRGFSPGETVVIEGVALPAWKLSVEGGTIEKVGADRFRGEVQTSAERPDIAVRLAHPRLGTHYYLRRAAGSR